MERKTPGLLISTATIIRQVGVCGEDRNMTSINWANWAIWANIGRMLGAGGCIIVNQTLNIVNQT